MNEYIYVAYNPAFHDNIYKIGRTDRTPHQRMDELYTTGVPQPFELLGWARVGDSRATEARIHQQLNKYRITPNREFFNITHEQALQVLSGLGAGVVGKIKDKMLNGGIHIARTVAVLLTAVAATVAIIAGTVQILAQDYILGGAIFATVPLWIYLHRRMQGWLHRRLRI